MKKLIEKYKNLECVDCAENLQKSLMWQGIRGKRIKLYTGFGIGRNSYIYDE
nr:papain fold toxin domain-containing protein [Gloeothece citriformis]